MFFSTNYQKPFWVGFLHAIIVLLYTIFTALIYLSITPLFASINIVLIEVVFGLFLTIVSLAIGAYFIFFAPLKLMLHHGFKHGTVMLASTLGWLFLFLLFFIVGLVITYPY
jgi:hypothetical protein